MKATFSITVLYLLLISIVLTAQEERKIDVGDHKIDIKINNGGPIPVVFEAGMGGDLSTWDSVFNIAGKFTNAITYSRAGLGESEKGPLPRTLDRLLHDFITVIDTLNIQQPLILVGHSWGGLLARYYTSIIPQRIGGIIIVDGSHEEQKSRFKAIDSLKWGKIYADTYHLVDSLKKVAISTQDSHLLSALSENDTMDEILSNYSEMKIKPLPDIPTVVLTSVGLEDLTKEEKTVKREMHSEWLVNSSNSMWIITSRSGHGIHEEQPDLVVNAIEFVINALLADIEVDN